MKQLITLSIFLIVISNLFAQKDAPVVNSKYAKWQQQGFFRGYNVLYESPKTLQDFIDFKNYGGNLFHIGTRGFMSEDAPYSLVQTNINGTDTLVSYCRRAGIYYVIAVRSGPGAYDTYLESSGQTGESRIWNTNDTMEQRLYANMLKMIVQRYAGDTLFEGINLVVEPRPKVRSVPANTSAMYKRLLETVFNIHMDNVYNYFISKIRSVDGKVPIIVENFAYSTPELFPPYDVNDRYIVYSYHDYMPKEYTNASAPFSVSYPGYYWNITYLSQQTYNSAFIRNTILSKVRAYQLSSGRPILMGEFGMFQPQNGGPNYINDVLSACKDYGWNFALWDWRRRSGQNWDIEIFQGDSSSHWKAVLSNFHAPPVPNTITPANGSVNTGNNPLFKWDSLTSFTNYDIVITDPAGTVINSQTNLNSARWQYQGTALQPEVQYGWQVRSKNPGGQAENWSAWSPVSHFMTGSLTGIINNSIPAQFSLSQNYPNPFNPATKIEFSVPLLSQGGVSRRDGVVSLTIYNILGKEIANLINGNLTPGSYEVTWDASNFPSGVYFYKLEVSNSGNKLFTDVKRMLLVK